MKTICASTIFAALLLVNSSSSQAQRVGSYYTGKVAESRIPIAVDWENDSPICFWLSNSRVLLIYHSSTFPSALRGLVVDVERGLQKSTKALDAALAAKQVFNVQDISSDRKRLLCTTSERNSSGYIEITMNGSVGRRWSAPESGHRGRWKPDGRGWIEATDYSDPAGILVGLKAGGTAVKLQMQGEIGFRCAGFLKPDEALFYSAPYYEQTDKVILQTATIRSGASVQSRELKLQNPATIVEMVVSPQKDRIAWLVQRKIEHNAFDMLLLRHGNRYSGISNEIWVSGFDGAAIQVIYNEEPVLGPTGTLTEFPQELRWATDGKRLSFIYRQALYLIQAGIEDIAMTSISTHN